MQETLLGGGVPLPGEPIEIEIVRLCRFRERTGGRRGCAMCGKAKRHRDHMGAPPSMNMWGRSGDGFAYMNLKDQWQSLLIALLREAGAPPMGGVTVEGECTFPDRRTRDQGNYRTLLEKALGDALTAGGWLEDDDWSRYEFGGLAYRYERGVSRTRLMLFPRA